MEALRLPFVAGALVGCLFVLALLVLDVGGLGTLVMRDQLSFLPFCLMLVGFGSLFGIVVAASGFAIDDHPEGRRLARRPIAVRASAAACRPPSPSR